jgi:hypothetical protein
LLFSIINRFFIFGFPHKLSFSKIWGVNFLVQGF